MKLYNGTGCLVHLIGTLFMMPNVSKNKIAENLIIVNRRRICSKNKTTKLEEYRVILNKHDTQRILKFGFPGMVIAVHGDLISSKNMEIIADKIEFMNYSDGNESQALSNQIGLNDFNQKEKSYWFDYRGELRNELTYIH